MVFGFISNLIFGDQGSKNDQELILFIFQKICNLFQNITFFEKKIAWKQIRLFHLICSGTDKNAPPRVAQTKYDSGALLSSMEQLYLFRSEPEQSNLFHILKLFPPIFVNRLFYPYGLTVRSVLPGGLS